MFTVSEVLLTAGVTFSAYPGWPAANVYLTENNQVIGSYRDLASFRAYETAYKGWHRHHIVEEDDLQRLGVANHAPAYEDQPCVLLPERAHVGRINSILRRANPTNIVPTGRQLRQAYADAYSLMGDYCGGGEVEIRKELLDIVNAQFQKLGIP